MITTILAIWGAFLSTILAVIKLIDYFKTIRINFQPKKIYGETEKGEVSNNLMYIHVINPRSHDIHIKGLNIITFNKFLFWRYNSTTIEVIKKSIKLIPFDNHKLVIDLDEYHSDLASYIEKINLNKNKHYTISVITFDLKRIVSKKSKTVKSLNNVILD